MRICLVCSALCAALVLSGTVALAQGGGAAVLRVISGDDAVSVLPSRRSVRPVVAVSIGGVAVPAGTMVRFQLPAVGPRAEFLDGTNSADIVTDFDGRAMAPEMRPVEAGAFRLRVMAVSSDPSSAIEIGQKIVEGEAGSAGGTEQQDYRIEILEGDDGVNIVSKKTAVKTVVRVVDRNNLPVAAVPVVIAVVALRGGGESRFPDGSTKITLVTDAKGMASAPGVDPGSAGKFELQVSATVNGSTVGRVVGQTNYATEAAALSAGKTPGVSAAAEGSSAGGSAQSASAAEAASASGSPAGGGATAGAVGAGAGMSGMQILGVVGGGLLAAGGIANATGAFKDKESTRQDCSGLINGFQSGYQSAMSCIQAARDPASQCRTQIQTFLSSMGGLCTCGGGSASLPAELRSLANQLAQAYAQLGFAYPSACR